MRKQVDIKAIRIFTTVLDSGWVVEIEYKDGKLATFSVDYGNLKVAGMLEETFRSIKLQLGSKHG